MTYLVFSDKNDAVTAEAQISANMGCPIIGVDAATGLPNPDAQKTLQWALPVLTDSAASTYPSSWVFPMPDAKYMTGVANYIEAEYDPTWFPPPAM